MTGSVKVNTDLCQGKILAWDMTAGHDLLSVRKCSFQTILVATLVSEFVRPPHGPPLTLSASVCGPFCVHTCEEFKLSPLYRRGS